jgi:hypothetical protein
MTDRMAQPGSYKIQGYSRHSLIRAIRDLKFTGSPWGLPVNSII